MTEERMHECLQELAEILCEDESVAFMFGFKEKKKDKVPKNIQMVRDFKNKEMQGTDYMEKMLVGFDWVGDEFGHPFCLFSHPDFIEMMEEYVARNEHFGVRVHAGEGLVRPSAGEPFNTPAAVAFSLHMYVLMASLRKYWDNFKLQHKKSPNLRIGHGVAFLYGCEDWNKDACIGAPPSKLSRDVKDFREFIVKNKIVCELSPTSNHMLLPDSFSGSSQLSNTRTLKTFIANDLPVILCTDDDGIWAIKKCKAHYRHVSVAHEYCHAIRHGEISKENFEEMVLRGKRASFRQEAPSSGEV